MTDAAGHVLYCKFKTALYFPDIQVRLRDGVTYNYNSSCWYSMYHVLTQVVLRQTRNHDSCFQASHTRPIAFVLKRKGFSYDMRWMSLVGVHTRRVCVASSRVRVSGHWSSRLVPSPWPEIKILWRYQVSFVSHVFETALYMHCALEWLTTVHNIVFLGTFMSARFFTARARADGVRQSSYDRI